MTIQTDTKTNADPVAEMMRVLNRAGRTTFTRTGVWETALCALLFALEPKCRTYRVLECLPYENEPLDRARFLNAFAHLGYHSRSVPARLNAVDTRLMPCLFIDSAGMPCVVLGREEGGGLRVYRDCGMQVLAPQDVPATQGALWHFERYDESRSALSKFRRAGTGHSWFRALAGRFKAVIGQVMAAGLFLNLLALLTPLYIMLVYDRVIAAGGADTLPMLAAGMAIAIFFEYLLRQVRSRGLSWLAARMDNIVGNRIFAHLTGLAPDLIERASVAAQIARIKTFESVRDFFSGSVFLSMLELPFVVLALAAIWAVAGSLVLVPLAFAGLYALLFAGVHKRVKVVIRLAAKTSSARQQFTMDTFEKIRGVRAYGMAEIWHSKFRDLSGREMMAHFRLNWLGMTAETLANALTLLAAVATVGTGVHLIWAGAMTTGALVASMILVWRVLTPFYSMCTMIPRLEQVRHSIIQVNQLMDIDTEAMEARAYARLPRMAGRVTFNRVSLRYGEGTDLIFENLNFEARPGDLAVITGPNGSGKSSLLKLVKGLYRAENGAVQIDGFDIRQLDAPDLRRHIAYVPQTPDFFHGSVLENLRIGNPLASEDDAVRALQAADAWEDVSRLPEGLGTIIGRHGENALPVNLAIRLSLARAYLHDASILLIDELPNTILSGRAGRNLKDYLARIKGKRTCLMVTYRADFMALADTVILLNRGAPPMAGPRENILRALQNKEAA